VVSQTLLAHVVHAAPPLPHCEGDSLDGATHFEPLQQPLGQDVGSHTHVPVALLHSCPPRQPPQACPSVPHDELDSAA
jgi:hypothetical protein